MKKQEDLVGLSRKSIVNQMHALVEKKPNYDMHGLVQENWVKWLFRNIANLGNTHYAYQSYVRPSENNGIFKIKETEDHPVSVALLSDWASDTPESVNIANLVGKVDYSIHLGDTYYVGNYKEIARNFNSTYGGPWPYGTHGSFALPGNHEMYSSGRSYFTQLLPYMGCHNQNAFQQQEASFFCLENEYWRIIGLDTGYDSLRGFLGVKPNLNLQLHEKQMQWLKNTVFAENDNRAIILLCHHQYISAFEKEYKAFGEQLASVIPPGKTVLWFCGHEHIFSMYGRNKLPNGSNFFLRCIGHGGMPVEVNEKVPKSNKPEDEVVRNLVLYDKRIRNRIDGKIDLGHNGFVILKLTKNDLNIEYFDDNKQLGQPARLLLTETWSIDTSRGSLAGSDIKLEQVSIDEHITVFAPDIKKAIH